MILISWISNDFQKNDQFLIKTALNGY